MSKAPSSRPVGRRQRCTLCGKPASEAYSPFCSQGCRDRDLLNWLGDAYRVPGPPVVEEDLATAPQDEED